MPGRVLSGFPKSDSSREVLGCLDSRLDNGSTDPIQRCIYNVVQVEHTVVTYEVTECWKCVSYKTLTTEAQRPR